jgi:hypothetical protein
MIALTADAKTEGLKLLSWGLIKLSVSNCDWGY